MLKEVETNDKNYIIKAMNGKILYDNKNFEDCYKNENSERTKSNF